MGRRDHHKRDQEGRFSKWDAKEQAHHGKRAHENWFQTKFRRFREMLGGLIPGRGRNRRGPRN